MDAEEPQAWGRAVGQDTALGMRAPLPPSFLLPVAQGERCPWAAS